MPIEPKSLTVPLDHSRRLDQHHHVQATRLQSIEPDPEQAIYRKYPGPTWSLTTKNVQLVTEGEGFQFHNRPTAESEGKNRDDGTHELKHAENTTAAHPKTLDFSVLSEFLVATILLRA
jgi:hypothetical protein